MAKQYSAVDETLFRTPDMGEYYDEDLIEEMMESIDPSNPKSATYYVETPFSTSLGYHPNEGVFVIKADAIISNNDSKYGSSTGAENEYLNAVDGDTMAFYLDSVEDGDDAFEINGAKYSGFKDYFYQKGEAYSFKEKVFKIRSVGIDAPEVPHYSIVSIKDSDALTRVKKVTIDKAKTDKYVYEKNKTRTEGELIQFLERSGKWHEIINVHEEHLFKTSQSYDGASSLTSNNVKYYTYVSTDSQTKDDMNGTVNLGIMAKEEVINLMSSAEDMRIVIDLLQLQTSPRYSELESLLLEGVSEDNSIWEVAKAEYIKAFGESLTTAKYAGFNTFGQDSYKRFLGAIYIKASINGAPSVWINLAKYVRAKVGNRVELSTGINPAAQSNGNNLNDVFKIWSYDNSNSVIADAFYSVGQADFDDRREIQKEITGLDFSSYRDYTVMIGDCLFMVPPTSIRIVNQVESERVNLLRSKGTATKTKPHNDRIIEMTLYFNGNDGINGKAINKQLPKQKGTSEHETYYMNGLRTLIAMFKCTPFLPIENHYINDVLGIEAVSLANLQIQTLPMYPNCLGVTLTLQQFNYRIYLNELPLPDPEKGEDFSTNMYARTINYGVMRYYYQRAIQAGERLKELSPISQDFIEETMGSKTKLIPMEFKDQTIKFQILDENWLDKMKQAKEAAARQPVQQTFTLNERTITWARKVGTAVPHILKVLEESVDLPENGEAVTKTSVWVFNRLVASQQATVLQSVDFKSGLEEDVYSFNFSVDSLTGYELNNLAQILTTELGIMKTEGKLKFEDGVLKITVKKTLSDTDVYYRIEQDEYYDIANFLAFRAGALDEETYGEDVNTDNWAGFSTVTNEEFLENAKDYGIDTETLLSAKFREYPLEIVAQQFNVSMTNILSNTKLKAYEGYAPQYAGGQDTVIDFMFHTQDESVVTLINSLQPMATEQLIRYRDIIKSWPIRIDSEMTRLCGVYEIIIESIDISTVPMQPGLYAIQCRAVSVDRTTRNREALHKLSTINNAGIINQSGISSMIHNTYFDLTKILSKAEIYPDLELPTINELDSTGYKFIRYTNNKANRIYPDPDFYFVYGYAYSSQMIRKSIIEYFDTNSYKDGNNKVKAAIENAKFSFYGKDYNQEVIVQVNTDNTDEVLKYDCQDKTEEATYNAEVEENAKVILASREQLSKKEGEAKIVVEAAESLYAQSEMYFSQLEAISPISWDVCSEIKCTLPEKSAVKIINEVSETKEPLEDMKAAEELIVKTIDEIIYTQIDASKHSNDDMEIGEAYLRSLRKKLKKFIEKETKENGSWGKIFSVFGVKSPEKVNKKISALYEAAAMALSGNTEYSEDAKVTDYSPRSFLAGSEPAKGYGLIVDDPSDDDSENYLDEEYEATKWMPNSIIIDKNTGEIYNAKDRNQALSSGITFGAFQIRMYDSSFLASFYPNNMVKFKTYDFLDPYYNSSLHYNKFNKNIDSEVVKNYKNKIMVSSSFAIEAFHRIVLIWVKKLIHDDAYISFFDIKRDEIAEGLKELYEEVAIVNEIDKEYNTTYTGIASDGTENSQAEFYTPETNNAGMSGDLRNELSPVADQGKEIIEVFNSYENPVILGKIFLPTICAAIHGDEVIYSKIKTRDVGSLKIKTRNSGNSVDPGIEASDGERNFRKMIRALAATDTKLMKNLDAIASESQTKLESALMDRSQKLWFEASEDPSLWVLHSFYDMVTNNKRGRMARAFPTYYMLFIDEGREMGYWKLHDNFYNMSSIAEIEVTKSRKMPADTAKIVMTNIFNTFSSDDEDVRTNYESNIRDVFNSIFSPRIYFEEEELKRLAQMNINKVSLKPGARIHLRMGYSGDASELPILFNGVVTEANTGDLVEIIAQSDGHEIVNDQVFNTASANDAADIANESSLIRWAKNFFTEGSTPKTLLRNIFTTKSGIVGNLVNKFTNGRFFNDNMFGISHFGEMDYKGIHRDGEMMQNIYECESRLPWSQEPEAGSLAEQHSTTEVPNFTIELKDKSVWNILNICAKASLDFIAGIAPFGIRSTMFVGRPHYYYAYDYTTNENGIIMEKRKPFQQYHLIDSYSDIIGNNIKANGRGVNTVAIPVYKGPNALNVSSEKQLEPLWADWDIYPEYQKTAVIDTGMTWKGNKLGSLLVNKYTDKWNSNGGQKIAWRMGANALKESFKDMYEGEVIIIGDTSIKPFDRVFLYDIYENMDGPMEVEAVVHRLTPETGFTSSVYADCISAVDSRYEEIGRMWTGQIMTQVVAAKSFLFATSKLFGTQTKPFLSAMVKTVNKGSFNAAKGINKVAEFLDKDEIIKYADVEEWSKKLGKVTNMSSDEVAIWNKLSQIKKFRSNFEAINLNTATTDDIIKGFKDMVNMMDGIEPTDITKLLEEAIQRGTIKKGNIDDIKKLVTTLNGTDFSINNKTLSNEAKKIISKYIGELGKVSDLDDAGKETLNLLKTLNNKRDFDLKDAKKAVNAIDSVTGITIELGDEALEVAKGLNRYGKSISSVVTKTDEALKIADVAIAVGTVTAAATAIIPTIIIAAVEMSIGYIIEKNVYNWIENKMASFNVLTVYPLKKNGTPHVAGIDGHTGLVYGSPTWNQAGPIDNFINWVFKDRDNLLYKGLDMFVFSEEMKAIAETYKKDNIGASALEKKEETINGLLKNISESQASAYSDYKAMINTDRITQINSPNANYTFSKTKVKSDLEEIPSHHMVTQELIPIDQANEVLVNYFNGTNSIKLKTIHSNYVEYQNSNENSIDYLDFNIDNSKIHGGVFKGIKLTLNTVDIPFVRPDAFRIINRMLELLDVKAAAKGYGDEEDVTLWFKSGTIVNDSSWSSTGYIFRFEITGGDASLSETVLKEIQAELSNEFIKANKESVIKLVDYRKIGGSNTYEVFVSPRDEYIKLQF